MSMNTSGCIQFSHKFTVIAKNSHKNTFVYFQEKKAINLDKDEKASTLSAKYKICAIKVLLQSSLPLQEYIHQQWS